MFKRIGKLFTDLGRYFKNKHMGKQEPEDNLQSACAFLEIQVQGMVDLTQHMIEDYGPDVNEWPFSVAADYLGELAEILSKGDDDIEQ